jgi:energy-coupling factor transporter ATP-binding protein EcfA2
MRIEKIDLPESATAQLGLKSVLMDRLGSVVVIAGKNGSGKSRLLELIKGSVRNTPSEEDVLHAIHNIESHEKLISQNELNFSYYEKELAKATLEPNQIEALKNSKENVERNIAQFKSDIEQRQKVIETSKQFTFVPKKESNPLIDFVPKSIQLQDSYTISPHDLDNFANRIYTIGTNEISDGTIPAIERIQKRWINANTTSVDDITITVEEKSKINYDYDKLKSYIKLFFKYRFKKNKRWISRNF